MVCFFDIDIRTIYIYIYLTNYCVIVLMPDIPVMD